MNESQKPKKSSKRQIVDVQEPGTSAPSATSKPVIVTNRPILRDPMMTKKADNEEATDQAADAAPASTGSSGKPKLTPLDGPTLTEEEDAPSAAAPEPELEESDTTSQTEQTVLADTAAQPGSTEPASPAPTPGDEEAVPETTETSPQAESTTTPNSPEADQPGQAPQQDTPPATTGNDKPKNDTSKQAEAEAAEQAKHKAAIQKLVDSKQYALPINTTEKRKNRKIMVLGIALCIVLALAWVDIALDAGIIKLGGLNSVTHFFSN